MAQIITTIGPASQDPQILDYFKEHSVTIARLNFSHNTADWHNEIGKICKEKGFETMVDLAGPKVLVGKLYNTYDVHEHDIIYFEKEQQDTTYPYEIEDGLVFPCEFDIHRFAEPKDTVLIDDGKIETLVESVIEHRVRARVKFGGTIRSHKGMNFPDKTVDLDFLVERDRSLLSDVIPELIPDYIAPSFVRTVKDIHNLKAFVAEIANNNNIQYSPKICVKLEMAEAIEDQNLKEIIQECELIMIARGDLALETQPIHIGVPFFQEHIINLCREYNKPFIIATQMLESMIESPVPTRAEVSDIYRAVELDNADYIMLSGETAMGAFPKKAVDIMHNMIAHINKQKTT